MKKLTEWQLGLHRLELLIARDQVVEELDHADGCPVREAARFELALCGWTEEAFIQEAYGWEPEHG